LRAWGHALAATLLLAVPLVAFLAANDYPIATRETGLLFAGCLAAGMVLGWLAARFMWLRVIIFGMGAALCVDLLYGRHLSSPVLALLLVGCLAVVATLRQHIAAVLAAAGSVFIAATLLAPASGAQPHAAAAPGPAPAVASTLPVVLHVILDEHIGLDGLPRDLPEGAALARWLADAYTSQGFRLHADAYSEYFDTRNSIANLLNFSSAEGDWAHLAKDRRKPYVLAESAYFRHLSELGYRLHVYQSDYLDYCRVPGIAYATCLRYRANSIASLAAAPLTVAERAHFIFNSLAGTSQFLERAREKYRGLRDAFRSLPLPAWDSGVNRVGPLAVLPVLQRLETDLRTAAPGNAYFAHLLIPHYPYLLDEGCHVRKEIGQWLYNSDPEAFSELEPNSAASRAQRYRSYFAQIRCQQLLVNRLFTALQDAGVWRNAIVIVHGDHGSRIVQHLPVVQNAVRLTGQDLNDGFSTLFAAKLPGQAPGVVRDSRPLQALLAEALGLATPHGSAKVLLRTEDGRGHRAFRLSQLRDHAAAD